MKGGKSKAETVKKADSRLSVKRKATDKVSTKPAKKEKPGKDPNKPKRPPSAFFIFMEEFRKQFKEKNPGNKSVAAVGKAAGEKWKSMSASDKAPYESKAAKRKAEYNKVMATYNKKSDVVVTKSKAKAKADEEDEDDEEESDKSKSEVNDEDDEEESGEEEDDD
ncbi:DNA-binding protein MNB1B-like [Magnolia sinica]|uniref:DNA-binding protein MNB1B-like n=1 Tax=Magnolia sinica TaxID=86752 RepID=UPI002657F962|nr:DNA-binding protein MNB1B-like [Magnolia sinica]